MPRCYDKHTSHTATRRIGQFSVLTYVSDVQCVSPGTPSSSKGVSFWFFVFFLFFPFKLGGKLETFRLNLRLNSLVVPCWVQKRARVAKKRPIQCLCVCREKIKNPKQWTVLRLKFPGAPVLWNKCHKLTPCTLTPGFCWKSDKMRLTKE